ncbi:MAG: DUF3794 domain-containing protein [Clostridia bacterium]|nr:DUF3794 domain-containing protein [Clostridia bacterium]
MEYSIKKENFTFSEKQIQTSAEQSFETEISLPDYCSDIRKILKCLVTVNIHSCQINGDRATAEGENVIRVLYVGESGKPECYEQSIPFSKYVEIRGKEGDCSCSVRGKVEYVNCRAVSQRRISISGNVGLIFTVAELKSLPLPHAAEGCEIETRCEKVNADMEVSLCNKIFEMGETVSLGEGQPPVSSVVRAEACAVTETVKAVENKLLIKGEMQVFVLYCADSENKELVRFKHTMPISQVFQVGDIDKDCICDADVSVCGVSVTPCADSNGKNTLFEISVKAEADICAYRNTDLTVVTDCYSTRYEMKCEYRNVDFLRHLFTYKETKQIRTTVDLTPLTVSEICDGFCKKTDGSTVHKNGKIEGKGNGIIGLIYTDTEGEYGYCERSVDFSFECQGKDNCEGVCAHPVFSVGEISCTSVGSDKAEIKMSVNVFMPIYETVSKKICVNMEPDEEHPKRKNDWELTVYFCNAGEQLWDIAEKYNTTVDRIKEENELTGETVTEKTILMIPS